MSTVVIKNIERCAFYESIILISTYVTNVDIPELRNTRNSEHFAHSNDNPEAKKAQPQKGNEPES